MTLGCDSVNLGCLIASNFIRVVATALVLSTLSFAAGVAGDLTPADGPTSGVPGVLRLPPEIPAYAPRAAPLPPLLSTASAEALPVRRVRAVRAEAIAPSESLEGAPPVEKPAPVQSLPSAKPKDDPDHAPKDEKRRKNS